MLSWAYRTHLNETLLISPASTPLMLFPAIKGCYLLPPCLCTLRSFRYLPPQKASAHSSKPNSWAASSQDSCPYTLTGCPTALELNR